MLPSRLKPPSVAIENVVFVEFRAPARIECRFECVEQSVSRYQAAVSAYTATIMETRALIDSLRDQLKLGGAPLSAAADPAAELLLAPGSGDSSPTQNRA